MRVTPLPALGVVGLLALAGCSGGGGEGQAAPATVLVTVSAPAAAAPSSPPSAAPEAPATTDVPSSPSTDSAAPSDSATASGPSTSTSAPSGGGGVQPSLGPDGRADPNTWPDACKLVTTEEIKAALPDAINVVSAGQRGNFSSGGETANYVNCTHRVALPTDTPGSPTQVEVELKNVADPRIVKVKFDRDKARSKRFADKYPDQYKEYGASLGADDCYLNLNALHCRTGALEFEVGGRSYDIGAGDYKKAQANFRQKTLGAVVRTLSEKIKSGGASVA